jgi:hypothetical protein
MFIVQETEAHRFTEITFGNSIVTGNVVHPWQVTDLWSAEGLETIGVFRVAPAAAPMPGAVVKGYHFERIEGAIVQILEVDLPTENTMQMKASARQIRLAMNQLGLREEIETWVASQPIDVRDSWQFTTEFEISHPFIVGAKEELNKSQEDLLGLFSLAQTFS